ncbi:MAG: hypothetical protein HQL82_09045 [Magnetococcales bacterium]|nr:hypothetical protein [Magnetococcales bacterium]
MESIEVAKIKPNQTVTLEFGNKEAILKKISEPNKFTMEDWFEDEAEIFILEPVIEEDAPLHYTFEPVSVDFQQALAADARNFGADKRIRDFLGRPVGGIEMEEEEEEDAAGGDGG